MKGSIDFLADNKEPVFMGFYDNDGELVEDDDGVEVGFLIQFYDDSPKCKELLKEWDQYVAGLPPNKLPPESKRKAFIKNMLAGTVVGVQGKMVFDGKVVIHDHKDIKRIFKKSRAIRKRVDELVGTPEAFTKGATEPDEE